MLEKMLKENTIARKKMHEEAMARQNKLLDILSKVFQNNYNSFIAKILHLKIL